MKTAKDILTSCQKVLEVRGQQYDPNRTADGERNMTRITELYNRFCPGQGITTEDGWFFMVCLKLVRYQGSSDIDVKLDCVQDAINYIALMGEEMLSGYQ